MSPKESPMASQIEQFGLGWHPQKGSSYRIKLVGGGWNNWIEVSSADLAALAAIFSEQPVFLQPDGAITTGPEPVGN
jgi:hypothetical protein